MDGNTNLTREAKLLGYAGLLPQIVAFITALSGSQWAYVALAGGFAYAALIFSFLGGVWWGQAIASGKASAGVYILSVLPSLISLALFLPWTLGWEWPGPALWYLGSLIALSPVVDRRLGFADRAFMQLRIHLSIGLGVLTFALGMIASEIV